MGYQPPPGYGPPQGYGQPPQGYGQTQGGYGQQPPGWGPPQQQPYMLPAPRKSRAGCVVVFLLMIGLFVGGILWVVLGATAPAREAGHAFLNELRKGDFEAANSLATGDLHETSVAEFKAAMEEEFADAIASTDATFSTTTVSGSSACLSGTLDTPSGSKGIRMDLSQDGDSWKVNNLMVGSAPTCETSGSRRRRRH